MAGLGWTAGNMLVCWVCLVKCPRGCWRRIAEKEAIKECAAQPSVVTWFAQGHCTCRASNMGRHAREVHGVGKDELYDMMQAAGAPWLQVGVRVGNDRADHTALNQEQTTLPDAEREPEARRGAIAGRALKAARY